MKTLLDWGGVPPFHSLDEEHEFWQQTQISPDLMYSAHYKKGATESTTITLRMDPRMLARLKRLANKRYLNYQSMMKQWVAERLEKEAS
ncbi:MAG: CopG family antitoxin [Verrucomicrobiota bacterium]